MSPRVAGVYNHVSTARVEAGVAGPDGASAYPAWTYAAEGVMEQAFGFIKGPSKVHHVAIVVRDMNAALGVYRDQLGLPLDVLLPIESDGVRIAFLPVGESNIELVEPTDPGTGVARFLESRGEGFHHVCLEVDDVA